MTQDNLFPTKGNVVVTVEPPKQKTASGIEILAEKQNHDLITRGVVVKSNSSIVLENDTVLFQRNKGTKATCDDEIFFFLSEKDIIAVVEP